MLGDPVNFVDPFGLEQCDNNQENKEKNIKKDKEKESLFVQFTKWIIKNFQKGLLQNGKVEKG